MQAVEADPSGCLGFLTVVEHPQHGYFGGYLLVNPSGRPLQFHCTAPVKTNRAQEILYGASLHPHLLGEQIGGTLVRNSQLAPSIILTDQWAVLAVAPFVTPPVALISPIPFTPEQRAHVAAFEVGPHHVGLPRSRTAEADACFAALRALAPGLDLLEPFERIGEAIREANQAA